MNKSNSNSDWIYRIKHSDYLTKKQMELRLDAIKHLLQKPFAMDEVVLQRALKYNHGKSHNNFRGSKYRGVTINGNMW